MTTAWKARPTTYRGIPMRSRLEATHAARLDALGWPWVYEPQAFAGHRGQYLPDFRVDRPEGRFYIEIKPTIELAMRVLGRMEVIWESEPDAHLLVFIGDIGHYRRPDPSQPWRFTAWSTAE